MWYCTIVVFSDVILLCRESWVRNLAGNVLKCFCDVSRPLTSVIYTDWCHSSKAAAARKREGIAELSCDLSTPLHMRFLCSQKSVSSCGFFQALPHILDGKVFLRSAVFLKNISVVSVRERWAVPELFAVSLTPCLWPGSGWQCRALQWGQWLSCSCVTREAIHKCASWPGGAGLHFLA